jgi:regulatory protein
MTSESADDRVRRVGEQGSTPSQRSDHALEEAKRWLARHGVDAAALTGRPERPPVDMRSSSARTATSRQAGDGFDSVAPGAPEPDLTALEGPGLERARQEGPGHGPEGSGPEGSGHGPVQERSADQHDPVEAEPDPESVARTIVLRKLAAQARTREELRKALSAKRVPDAAAERVLNRMEAVGLVDDTAFAHDWVRSRQQRRHLSRGALRRELGAKGVDPADVEAALEQVDVDDEIRAARLLAQKKLRSMEGVAPQVRYRRLAGALARRGFSAGIVHRVLSEVADPQVPPG